ncbi:GNAT family N-acetyltransferase [Streptomyces sp. AK02-01A]|uniref:GNAT family N-acetyltransferase n=1 Tax=Streptomyces sp. AK02-01A TaxID=3028648 RepID=UPI0029A5FDB6|nr:GNAT family N-acetyltransferase [Streptomyces sp. AK02-01A]MDX3851105.1 GNAT family N-acetyltransferase [Streptomyces sp. AK02-01A]
MRPAATSDRPAVAKMIHARCDWMERRGLPTWRESVDDLAGQCDNPYGDVWLLEMDGSRIVGRTTVQDQGPPWGWTTEERSEPAFYLNTSVTDPALRHLRLGTLMAWWALDRAAGEGREWVRRDCLWPDLVRYYEAQGFTLFHEVERTGYRLHMLGRRAERIEGLQEWFRTGMPAPPSAGR